MTSATAANANSSRVISRSVAIESASAPSIVSTRVIGSSRSTSCTAARTAFTSASGSPPAVRTANCIAGHGRCGYGVYIARHRLAREAVVLHVAGDADHLGEPGEPPDQDLPADRRRVRPGATRQPLADDDDERRRARCRSRDRAAGDDRNPHRREVAGRDGRPLSDRPLADRDHRLIAGHVRRHRGHRRRQRHRRRRARDAGQPTSSFGIRRAMNERIAPDRAYVDGRQRHAERRAGRRP